MNVNNISSIEFNEIDSTELNGVGSFLLGVGAGVGTVALIAGGIVVVT